MSYCRFSSDNFACDVYAYESCLGGYQIHVAGNRVVGDIPKVPRPSRENMGAWQAAHAAQMSFLDTCKRVDIELPHAAGAFNEPTASACADRLESLRALGYRVPQSAIDTLREEAAEVAP